VTSSPAPPPGSVPSHALQRIVQRCVAELDVDAAAIAVTTGPRSWTPAYATEPDAERLEQYAFTTGEGPCADVLRTDAPVLEPDLRSGIVGARWPVWSVAAQEVRMLSVAAFPVRAGVVTAGVLTLYSRSAGVLDGRRYALALRLTDLAFLGLLDVMAGLEHNGADPAEEPGVLADLLSADVHRAAGMIMAQAEIPIEQALARLRARAFSSGRPLAEVAADVVKRRLRFEKEEGAAE
jgi:hypothetical protein